MIKQERRRAPRVSSPDHHGIVLARVRAGDDVAIVDVSCGGALVETQCRLLPGAFIDLHLVTATRRTAMRGSVLRCAVCAVRAAGIFYRGAIAFDRTLPWFSPSDGNTGYPLPAYDVHPHRGGWAHTTPEVR